MRIRRISPILTLLIGVLVLAATPAVAQSVDDELHSPSSASDAAAHEAAAVDFPMWSATMQTASFSNQVTGVAVHPTSGDLLIGSRFGTALRVVDPTGTETGTFLDGQVVAPEGIEIANGEIYVAEAGSSDRISVWSLAGAPLRSWGATGTGNGQFSDPCDIAISPTNEIYVLDAVNDRVQVFDINGVYQRQWGSTGSGNGQFDLWCTHSAVEFFDGEIYVTDTLNQRIQVFDPDGNYIRQWGSMGSGNGQFNNVTGLDIAAGMVYVADFGNDRIQVFTTGGTFQGSIALNDALAVAVDPTGTVVWATANDQSYSTFTTLKCSGQALTHVGSHFGDNFAGTPGDDIVHLGAGPDTYQGRAGDDVICGGQGNDTLRGSGGADIINGGQGKDVIYGGDKGDTLKGGQGNDTLRGGNGNDTINGQVGNDKAFGEGGRDTLNGNEGKDTLNGGPGVDVANGGFGDDVLNGNAGDDTLRGGGRNDVLRGNAGNDSLIGGEGSDECHGGPDVDTAQTCETVTGVP